MENCLVLRPLFTKPTEDTPQLQECVYSKKSQGKGVASALINYICSLGLGALGAIPWNDNPAMCHVFEKFGFEYQYTFNTFYKFYKKSA